MTSCPPHQQRQIARKKKEQQKRQHQRDAAMQRQRKRAEVNILRYVGRWLNGLDGENLQTVVLEFAITPEVTHGIMLRQSGLKSYFELMMAVVNDMIDRRLIECYEDDSKVAIVLPYSRDIEPSPAKLQAEAVHDTEPIYDWSTSRIIKCKPEFRRILVIEY